MEQQNEEPPLHEIKEAHEKERRTTQMTMRNMKYIALCGNYSCAKNID